MKISFALVSDAVFYLFLWFLLSFILINFFIPRPISYVLSVTVALVFTLFCVKLSIEKRKKSAEKKTDDIAINGFTEKLNIASETRVLELFKTAFIKNGNTVIIANGKLFIPQEKTAVFFRYNYEKVDKAYIVKTFNTLKKDEKAEIWSNEYDKEISDFANRFDGRIILKDKKDAFALLVKGGTLSESEFTNGQNFKPEKKKGIVLDNLLNKKRAVKYALYGLFFLILSYFAPIKIYYAVFGAIFLIFALILRIFGKTEKN